MNEFSVLDESAVNVYLDQSISSNAEQNLFNILDNRKTKILYVKNRILDQVKCFLNFNKYYENFFELLNDAAKRRIGGTDR